MSKQLTVAIVGRTNVGKSTLFNRLSSTVKSLTFDRAGVTRDVLKDVVTWHSKSFELVDTGGIEVRKSTDIITEKIRQQALHTIEQADLVLLVVDGSVGVVQEDREISRLVHKLAKRTIVIVNKSDRADTQEHIHEAYTLGHDEVVAVSAQHGKGIGELLDLIVNFLPDQAPTVSQKADYRVMFLGRPNAGKSSLMNSLLNYERTIVSDIPGTTREPISERIEFKSEHIALIDTPGVRRKRAIHEDLETLMAKSSLQSVHDADVVVMLIDASEGTLVDQDLKLAFYSFAEHYKPLVILINKSDLLTEELTAQLESSLEEYGYLLNKVPVLRISCKTGKNVDRVLATIQGVWKRAQRQIPTIELMHLFKTALRERPLMHKGMSLILNNVYQLNKIPVTIMLEVNEPAWFESSQLAFFENLLRSQYNLEGVPVHFLVRKYKK